MKRLIFLITALVSFFLLSVSGSASETIDDLTRIHKNLKAYIYKPYFENSRYFEEYEVQMDFVSGLLESDDITQAEIDIGYSSLKGAYAKMMQDTYNYSELPQLIEYFDSIDGSIFTEESWKKMVSCTDEIKTELDSPAIYYREDTDTETSYRAKTQAYIDGFETKFSSAFNQLKFNDNFLDDTFTKDELSAYHALLSICTNESLMKDIEGYRDFVDAMDYAQNTFDRQNPGAERILRSKTNLENAYVALIQSCLDFTVINTEIENFNKLIQNEYDSKSFTRYQETIDELSSSLSSPHYFYFPNDCTKAEFKHHSEDYLKSLTSGAKNAYAHLLPTTIVEELKKLCDQYRNLETMDGLELKLSLLQNAVKEGDKLIENMSDTREKFEKAIKVIENAYDDLKTAENYLIQEQAGIVKQDPKTVKMIIIFALFSVFLSITFAILVSKKQYGIIDWTK